MATQSLPVPQYSTRLHPYDDLGLHLLVTSLRRQHIERVTEHVRLVDARHASRTMDVDLDLEAIPGQSRNAIAVSGEDGRPNLWVPIARHPRATLGTVDLKDGRGELVTRVPSTTTNAVLAAGLIRLLWLLADTADRQETATWFWNKRFARWLLQSAIISLVQEGRTEFPRADHTPTSRYRAEAMDILRWVLDLPAEDERHAFLELVTILADDQIIVAELPAATKKTRVSYEAAEMRRAPRPARRLPRLGPGEFWLDYTTRIPGEVDSFHVVMSVPEELEVTRLLLVSDADERAEAVLLNDLEGLRTKLTSDPGLPGRLIDYELRSIRSRLAVLGRRRAADDDRRRRLDPRADRLPVVGDPTRAVGTAELVRADPLTVDLLGRLHIDSAAPGVRPGAQQWTNRRRADLARDLGILTNRLPTLQLGQDLVSDNDPSETRSHAQWRRSVSGLELPGDRQVRARVIASITDAGRRYTGQVLLALVINMLLMSVVLWVLSQLDPTGAGEGDDGLGSEVTVTLLLLIPGLLIGWLINPPGRSILATLSAFPTVLGYLAIGLNVSAAVVLVVPNGDQKPVGWSALLILGAQVVLVALTTARSILTWRAHRRDTPLHDQLPQWLFDRAGIGKARRKASDAQFVDVVPERVRDDRATSHDMGAR